jgi:uncharacterized protein
MELSDPALFAALGIVAGLLIGCVGIGGVIVVPALVYVAGIPIHTAIAAALFAFLLSGIVGTWVFARNESIRWNLTACLWAGAMPAAFAGALLASVTSAALVEAAVGVLATASGMYSLSGNDGSIETKDDAVISKSTLAVVGAGTGFASALTGTGGPLVLIPILVALKLPVLAAIGLAQAIQLPIAALATGGNLVAGTLDPLLGGVLGVGIAFGTSAGARLAHVMPQTTLRVFVSTLLVVVGAMILVKLAIAAAR